MNPSEAQLSNNCYQIAVIGAGPMGSFVARKLAEAGLSVALLEKDKFPGETTVCAGGMHRDVVKFVDIPESIIEKKIQQVRLFHGKSTFDWNFKVPMYLMINRKALDRVLAECSVKAGAKLITEARVIDVDSKRNELVYLSGQNKTLQKLKAQVFIFADGPQSLSKKIFGEKNCHSHKFYMIGYEYDLAFQNHTVNRIEGMMDYKKLPLGYYWIFPKKDHLHVGLVRVVTIEGPPLKKLLDEFIQGRADLRDKPILRKKGGVIPLMVNSTVQKENCLVIGDAAGMVNPLTGGGYICGFLSAQLAAQTCIDAFKNGQANINYLKVYQRKLKGHLYYQSIRSAHYFMRFMIFVGRKTNYFLIPFLFTMYGIFIHGVMKFRKVLK